jgi:Xaa-Pro aminopeptidase
MSREQNLLTPQLYQQRIDGLRKRAAELGLDSILLCDPSNIFYFAGFWGYSEIRPIWLFIPLDKPCSMVIPHLEIDAARLATWVKDLREWTEWSDPVLPSNWATPLADIVKASKAGKRIGIEAMTMSVSVLNTLRGALGGAEFVEVDLPLAHLRMVKDSAELALMRAGGIVAAAQLEGAKSVLAEGVPEYELTLAARAFGTRAAAELLGPDYYLMSPLVTGVQIMGSGPVRGAITHARASTYRLKKGDIVTICFCGQHYFAYYLGFDRPLLVSKPTPDQAHLFDVAMEAQNAALNVIKPGLPAAEVDAAAVRVLEKAKMVQFRTHRTGRSVGASRQERPELRDSDRTPLRPGMTFTVEPGIYVPGLGGARFGDTVAVTETGYEMLTPAPYYWQGK